MMTIIIVATGFYFVHVSCATRDTALFETRSRSRMNQSISSHTTLRQENNNEESCNLQMMAMYSTPWQHYPCR
jgi:hypothetical protein